MNAHTNRTLPEMIATAGELRARSRAWRAIGQRVALVPTMGALHAGHLSLLLQALAHADRAIVSIFVNPTQFAPGEDLAAYPRTFDADVAAIARVGPAVVYAPEVRSMYPDGFATTVSLGGPAIVGLEDRFRPTHFAGVATVVAKLLLAAEADTALFGEKDYQQLKVVERMALDLDMATTIVGCPTVREADGLAMSSRNRFLSVEARARAPLLHAALRDAAAAIKAGTDPDGAAAEAADRLSGAGFAVDYVEARDARTLRPVADGAVAPLRLLAAARLADVRLIDNIAVH